MNPMGAGRKDQSGGAERPAIAAAGQGPFFAPFSSEKQAMW
jgi:hypothetical protein